MDEPTISLKDYYDERFRHIEAAIKRIEDEQKAGRAWGEQIIAENQRWKDEVNQALTQSKTSMKTYFSVAAGIVTTTIFAVNVGIALLT